MKKNSIFIAVVAVVVIGAFIAFTQLYKNQDQALQDQTPRASTADLIKAHSPSLGSKDAPVQLVEFLDPECEACKMMDPIVKGLVKSYEGKIHYVVRYMPFHANSMLAAVTLEEAREHGKYWEALSTLFYNQPEWGDHHNPRPELIATYVEPLGIPKDSLKQEDLLRKHKWKVDLDEADGKKLGVNRTPSFFVNGKLLSEIGYEPIKAAIDAELQKSQR